MAWTEAHIKKLAADGKIRGYRDMSPDIKKVSKIEGDNKQNGNKIPKLAKKIPVGLQFITDALTAAGINYVTEYRFHDTRKFRFDVAIPDKMIAIEYEGLVSKKSRHTTLSGYSKDASKYNMATLAGWKVYRYTVRNYLEFNLSLLP